jgi:acyl-CoA thioester hydrolase
MAAFVHRLRVRYAECDPQGWVFNAHYLAYFDVALTELWREAIGPYGEMVEQGVDMVVAESQLRYLAPAHFDQELEISLEIERLGHTSMTTDVTMCVGSTAVVRGKVRHVFIAIEGSEKGEKVEIPLWIRRGLERFVGSAPEPETEPAPEAS